MEDNYRSKEINQDRDQCYTNVYVKKFGKNFGDDELMSTFEKFGKIVSAEVMKDENGESRGCGFVNFKTHDAASKAIETMNGSVVNGRPIHCSRPHQRFNLYIGNLEEELDEEQLRKEFAKFGKIVSAKVMRYEDGRSKGYGFVCFFSSEAATEAIDKMNGRIIVSKPLYVVLAKRKKERVAQRSALHMQQIADGIPDISHPSVPSSSSARNPPAAHSPPPSQGTEHAIHARPMGPPPIIRVVKLYKVYLDCERRLMESKFPDRTFTLGQLMAQSKYKSRSIARKHLPAAYCPSPSQLELYREYLDSRKRFLENMSKVPKHACTLEWPETLL